MHPNVAFEVNMPKQKHHCIVVPNRVGNILSRRATEVAVQCRSCDEKDTVNASLCERFQIGFAGTVLGLASPFSLG